jgi:phosphoglycerate kinase
MKDLKVTKGTRVLLRLDFNVPINDAGKIMETFRIDESVPTILALVKKGAKVIILAHRESGTLAPVAKYLKKIIAQFSFVPAVVGESVLAKLESMQDGEVVLLENLRSDEGEKKNDKAFAKILTSYGDVFINDAFSASHRKHASIVGVPKLLPSALGPLFVKEIQALEKALSPKKPFLFILGGAKFETKLGLLNKYVHVADTVFVGGALAHSFFVKDGLEIGTSLLDSTVKLSPKIAKASNVVLPFDVVVETAGGAKSKTVEIDGVSSDERVVDFGAATLEVLCQIASEAKTIVWNGPLGWYEKGYGKGTKDLLTYLGKLKGKTVILGGGDTVAVASKLLKSKKDLHFTHISTGGGAMIDYLSSGTLPGIEAVQKKLK